MIRKEGGTVTSVVEILGDPALVPTLVKRNYEVADVGAYHAFLGIPAVGETVYSEAAPVAEESIEEAPKKRTRVSKK